MNDLLLLAFVFLAAGVLAVPIAARFGLGSVLGYLIAGIVISPLMAMLGVDVEAIQHFAELGVVMMLFLVGLELAPARLWAMRHRLLGLGGGQVILSAAAIAGLALLPGLPWPQALAIGLVFALSSTAIVLQTLDEKGWNRREGGRASFAVLLSQDIAVIPMLALLPLLASPELLTGLHTAAVGSDSGSHSGSLADSLNGWQRAIATAAAIGIIVLGGRWLTTPLLRLVAQTRLRELFSATALMVVVGIALLMSAVGLSPALGTFLAGVVLASSSFRHELEADLTPFKGLLLGLFFMTVGAGINFALLFEQFFWVLGITLLVVAVKAIVLWLLGWAFRLKGADRWLFALGLAQVGEFGFVLLTFTAGSGVLPAALADRLVLVVALSMLLSPALFVLLERVLLPRLETTNATPNTEAPPPSRILIAGSGRVGGLVNGMLRAAGFETTVIDIDVRRLAALERFGIRHHFGDATQPDLLHAAGINGAELLVVALDDAEQANQVVRHARRHHPALPIVARAVDRHHAYDLHRLGCRAVERETHHSSLMLGRHAFEALGIRADTAAAMTALFDAHDREATAAVAAAYRTGVPVHENPEYIARTREWFGERAPSLQARMQSLRSSNTMYAAQAEPMPAPPDPAHDASSAPRSD